MASRTLRSFSEVGFLDTKNFALNEKPLSASFFWVTILPCIIFILIVEGLAVKKLVQATIVMLSCGVVCAEGIDKISPKNATSITYKITVVPDTTKYDEESWAKVVESATRVIECGNAADRGVITDDEFIETMIASVKSTCDCHGKDGIHVDTMVTIDSNVEK